MNKNVGKRPRAFSPKVDSPAAETETPNRATVALVAERLAGLKAVTELGFARTQDQLGALVNLPTAVAALEAKSEALEERIEDLENEQSRHREWRRGPLLLVSGAIFVAAINLIPVLLKT